MDAEAKPARVIAVVNQKGGVGKSTTAVSLGAALAEMGRRVLLVDLDPQGNASTGLGIRHAVRDVTTYEILLAQAPMEEAVVPTEVEGLWAVPSTIDLAGAEIELVSQFSREMRLARALDPVRHGAYDFVFLDCPPSLGLLTVNALAASDEILVPIQCEYYALEGLGQLLRNVRLIQQNVNPRLRLTGIVLTMFDSRTKLAEQVVAEVRRYFVARVYDTIIPRTVRLSEAPGYGLPITVYDPSSKGAATYRALAAEVEARDGAAEGLPPLAEFPVAIRPAPRPAGRTRAEEAEEAEEAAESMEEESAAAGGAAVQESRPGAVAPEAPSSADEPQDGETLEPADASPVPSGTSPGPSGADAEPAVSETDAVERSPESEPAEAPRGEPAPPSPTSVAAPVAAPNPTRPVILIDDEPETQSPEIPEPVEQPAAEPEAGRRRWRLFRRGGRT